MCILAWAQHVHSMCITVSLALVAQVNPHVAPFYAHLRGRPGRPSGGRARTGAWRGGFLLGALEVSIKEDLKKQLRTLQALQLDWKFFGCDWSHMWLQQQDAVVGVRPPSLSQPAPAPVFHPAPAPAFRPALNPAPPFQR